jgi:hypothetical protein
VADLLSLIAPELEANVRQIAQDTGVEVRLLQALSQAIAAGVVAGAAASGKPVSADQATSIAALLSTGPAPRRVISLPLAAESINQAIIAARVPTSEAYLYSNSFGLPVPPLSTYVHTFGSGGLPTTTLGPLTVNATGTALVDQQVTLQVTIDGTRDLVGPPESPDYTIFEKGAATFGQNLVILNSLTISLTSHLTEFTVAYFTGNFLRMSQGFYRLVYQPLIQLYGLPELRALMATKGAGA